MNLFPLGNLVITPGALATFQAAEEKPEEYLALHQTGNWGELSEADWQENERSLQEGYRLFSVYRLKDETKIWIVTEADRSCTTLLLPAEY